MKPRQFGAYALFCLAASVMAAALIDPLLEYLSNRGVFGPGDFTDHSTIDVVPAVVVGLGIACAVSAVLVRRGLARSADAPAWLRTCALAGDAGSRMLVPLVYGGQLAVLWAMETVEQIAVFGHVLGGTRWLGAPAPVSLAVHALGCLAVTALLARLIRWSATTIVEIVAFIREHFTLISYASPSRRVRRNDPPISRFHAPMPRRLAGRAPPLPVT